MLQSEILVYSLVVNLVVLGGVERLGEVEPRVKSTNMRAYQ